MCLCLCEYGIEGLDKHTSVPEHVTKNYHWPEHITESILSVPHMNESIVVYYGTDDFNKFLTVFE